jgi:hypothetical protein
MRTLIFTICLLILFTVLMPVQASDIPQIITHQGVLTETDGTPVEDGTYVFTFRIYDIETEGTELWMETQEVEVVGGIFSVRLGSVIPLGLDFETEYWLGITVDGGDELQPRIPFSSVPYAIHARSVSDGSITTQKLADDVVSTSKIQDGAVTIEKLADDIELSHYTRFSGLNVASVDVSSSWTKLNIGTRTFEKIHDDTKIEVFLYSRARSGTFSGATSIRYQLRIDGSESIINVTHVIFSSATIEYITLKSVFLNLSKGIHEVEVWAQTNSGTSSAVSMDPGGWGGSIFVKEEF